MGNDPAFIASIASIDKNRQSSDLIVGALAGITQEEAFFVKCDRTTMSQDDIDNGRLICQIGISPVKPAEFAIFRISQKRAEAGD